MTTQNNQGSELWVTLQSLLIKAEGNYPPDLIQNAIDRGTQLEQLNRNIMNYRIALNTGCDVQFLRKAMFGLSEELGR